MSPAIGRACSENKIAAFSMPLGVYGQLLNAIGSKRPGIITHVGLNTYADPRQDGCKMNALAKGRRQRDGGTHPRFREGLPFLQSIPH